MVETTKLYINGKDAKATWGLQLDEGGLDILEGLPQMKEPVVNKNVTAEGEVVVCGTGLLDARSLSVPVHIVAGSYSDFRTKRDALITELRNGKTGAAKRGLLEIVVKTEWKTRVKTKAPDWTPKKPKWVYVPHTTEEERFSSVMYYQACNQYTSFTTVQQKIYDPDNDTWADVADTGSGIAKFVLSLYEPNEPTT